MVLVIILKVDRRNLIPTRIVGEVQLDRFAFTFQKSSFSFVHDHHIHTNSARFRHQIPYTILSHQRSVRLAVEENLNGKFLECVLLAR